MRRTGTDIFQVTVPATIIRSDWRGDARNSSAPKRAMSYRGVAVAIISMAQQASPNITGHSDARRAQLTIPSTEPTMMFWRTASSTGSDAPVTLISVSSMACPVARPAQPFPEGRPWRERGRRAVSVRELYHKVVSKRRLRLAPVRPGPASTTLRPNGMALCPRPLTLRPRRRQATQAGDDARQDLQDVVHLLYGVVTPHRQSH